MPPQLRIAEQGILSRGVPGTDRAMLINANVTALSDGTLLATARAGSSKDAADEMVELYRSTDGGRTCSKPERPFPAARVDGQQSSLRVAYISEIEPGRLLAVSMWIDRETYGSKPFFDPNTEGCLPMGIYIAESSDVGRTWTDWRQIPMPAFIGPPSLTDRLIQLPDEHNTLILSIETNKHYEDASQWFQRVVFFHSTDGGQTWGAPFDAGYDPSGRIFNWDQRVGMTPGGDVVTFNWTYDTQSQQYLNIHRRVSTDGGHSFTQAEDLGFADQPSHPAIFTDGTTVLAWVDRYGSQSIRARLAPAADGIFDPATEIVVYDHQQAARKDISTGEMLVEMGRWTFGLPFCEALPDGDVLVLYYAGDSTHLDIHWARLSIHP